MASMATAYLDESGRPRLRESITAFLDVLGFSHTVLTAAHDGKSQQCLDSIVHALNAARTFVRTSVLKDEASDGNRWAIKFFSDNLLFGCPCDAPDAVGGTAIFALQCVYRYQLQMALGGFFVRGAVTLGPLCVTDEIIFGTALIESYQLEAKASIVPRVVLTEAVLKAIATQLSQSQDSPGLAARDLICRDIDGWWFLNYLHAAIEPEGMNWQSILQHKKSVLASLSRSPRHDILPKFGWVSRYHNVFCHWHRNAPGYSDEYRIQRIDEESAIERFDTSLLPGT